LLLLCRMVLRLVRMLVRVVVLVLRVLLLQVVARGLCCRHVVELAIVASTTTAIIVVVHGSLDRHGGSADVVVLRRSCAKVLGVFRLTLVSSLVAPAC
jgi:hypothetical protein